MPDLNRMFPKGRTYATYGNAERKLNKVLALYSDEDKVGFHTVIIPFGTEDGDRHQIIVIVGIRCRIPVGHFLSHGLCVTNV